MNLPPTVSSHIHQLRMVHEDNHTLRYFAEYPNATILSTMYLTPFVHQYFIYNSLYQWNWPISIQDNKFISLTNREEEQQEAFVNFIRENLHPSAEEINRAFVDIEVFDIIGSWTKIEPDDYITVEEGDKFFADLRNFQEILRKLRISANSENLPEFYKHINDIRHFLYLVRCNIFHGRKSLADVVESNQNKRIKLYYYFIYGLVTLFFISLDK